MAVYGVEALGALGGRYHVKHLDRNESLGQDERGRQTLINVDKNFKLREENSRYSTSHLVIPVVAYLDLVEAGMREDLVPLVFADESRRVHRAAVADDQNVFVLQSGGVSQLEVSVLDLEHRFQQVLLKHHKFCKNVFHFDKVNFFSHLKMLRGDLVQFREVDATGEEDVGRFRHSKNLKPPKISFHPRYTRLMLCNSPPLPRTFHPRFSKKELSRCWAVVLPPQGPPVRTIFQIFRLFCSFSMTRSISVERSLAGINFILKKA